MDRIIAKLITFYSLPTKVVTIKVYSTDTRKLVHLGTIKFARAPGTVQTRDRVSFLATGVTEGMGGIFSP